MTTVKQENSTQIYFVPCAWNGLTTDKKIRESALHAYHLAILVETTQANVEHQKPEYFDIRYDKTIKPIKWNLWSSQKVRQKPKGIRCKVLIGEVKETIANRTNIEAIVTETPLPSPNSSEDCVDWAVNVATRLNNSGILNDHHFTDSKTGLPVDPIKHMLDKTLDALKNSALRAGKSVPRPKYINPWLKT